MPVTILTQSRVVAAPAQGQLYNIPDSEWKGFAVRVCNYLREKSNKEHLLFENRSRFASEFSQQNIQAWSNFGLAAFFYNGFFRSALFWCVDPTGQIFGGNLFNYSHASRTVI